MICRFAPDSRVRLVAYAALMSALVGSLAACGGMRRSSAPAPDPVNFPTNDYDAPERAKAQAALPTDMPPVPAPADTVRFYVSPTTTNHFAVAPASISIRDGRIVQFVRTITAAGGARNVGYEAIDCERQQGALLATGADGEPWRPVASPKWRDLRGRDTVNPYLVVLADAWCDGGGVAGKTPELIRRLKAPPSRYAF